MRNKITNLVDSAGISNLIKRISHEILESSNDKANLALIGIQSRGDHIANRIATHINSISKHDISLGTIDVTFHRDDYKTNLGSPEIGVSDIKFDVNHKDIVLIDDVLYTGRTIRAAMDEIFSYGRPNSIHLAVMVDRGHRELPIKAEFVGSKWKNIWLKKIDKTIKEMDSEDLIYLEKES